MDVRDALIHILTERVTELESSVEHKTMNAMENSLFTVIKVAFRFIAQECKLSLEYSSEGYVHWYRHGSLADLSVTVSPADTGPFSRKYEVVATGVRGQFKSTRYLPSDDYERWIQETLEIVWEVLSE